MPQHPKEPSVDQLQEMLNQLKINGPQPSQETVNVLNYCSVIQDDLEDEGCFEEDIVNIDVSALNRNLMPLSARNNRKPEINQELKAKQTEREKKQSHPILQSFHKHLEKVSRKESCSSIIEKSKRLPQSVRP